MPRSVVQQRILAVQSRGTADQIKLNLVWLGFSKGGKPVQPRKSPLSQGRDLKNYSHQCDAENMNRT